MNIITRIISKIKGDDARTTLARKNIAISLVIKGIAMLSSFIMVPLTLNYLDNEAYGIWLTISSILFWFTFFDVGLGTGMRNYLSAAVSNNDMELGKKYVSTTFILLFILAAIFAVIISLTVPFIDLNSLFNTRAIKSTTLTVALLLALYMTLAFFVVRNVGTIYISMQLPFVNDALSVSGTIVGIILIAILSLFTKGDLTLVVAAFTIPPVLIFLIAAIPTFRRYKDIKPSFKAIDWKLSHNIIGKGIGFFIIQITSCLVIYGSSNLFVTHFCGPREVTNYGIAYKYINLLSMLYVIFLTPYWNAYTDAYVKNDMKWIGRTFKKTFELWGIMALAGLCLVAFAPLFYHLWVGNKVTIPVSLSLCTLFYICMYNLNNCVTYLINGLNKIRVQILTSLVFTALYIVAVFIIKGRYGAEGIVLAMGIAYLLMALIHFYQCHLLINNKAKGIWNK